MTKFMFSLENNSLLLFDLLKFKQTVIDDDLSKEELKEHLLFVIDYLERFLRSEDDLR